MNISFVNTSTEYFFVEYEIIGQIMIKYERKITF